MTSTFPFKLDESTSKALQQLKARVVPFLKTQAENEHKHMLSSREDDSGTKSGSGNGQEESSVGSVEKDLELELSLLRFLRARKLEVEGAYAQFTKSYLWRIQVGVNTILDYPDPNEQVFQRLTPHAFHKCDKMGHPVYIERTGLVKMPIVIKYVSEQELLMRHVRTVERTIRSMKDYSRQFGYNVEKQLIIMDLNGLSLRPDAMGMRLFRETLRIDQQYYPERLFRLFIINAPWLFSSVWALIKNWLDPVTKQKVEVLGSNYSNRLLEMIDADSLPVEFGGRCACPGPAGCIAQQQSMP